MAVPVPEIEVLMRHAAAESEQDTRTQREAQTEPEPEGTTAISVVAVRQMAGVEHCDIRADAVIVRFHRHATSEQRSAVDRVFSESSAVRRRRANIARAKSRG